MERYEDKIDHALQYLKQPSRLSPTGNSPIVSIVYNPEDTMEIRSLISTLLIPKAKYYDFNIHFLSVVDILEEYIEHNRLCAIWTKDSVKEEMLYSSIRQSVAKDEVVENAILSKQAELAGDPNSLIVIKDIEMLHPFAMIGAVENKIYTKVNVPILILYPGEAQGMARSFLGIYNQDGSYRAINF